MLLNNTGYVFHAAVTHLEDVLIKWFIQFVVFGKYCLTSIRSVFPMLVLIFLAEWGIKLYHCTQSISLGVILRLFKLE